jgi:D-alanyl-D-alanine carboxypeptidase (penicillin-binding protein 5/6)
MRLISVVLGSPSVQARESGSAALLNYGFNFYETVPVKKAGEMVSKPRVYKGTQQYIALAPATGVQVTVPRGQAGTVTVRTEVRQPLRAPLAANAPVGRLQVSVAGKMVANVPLYPATAVAAGGLWRRLVDTVILWF